MLSQTENSIHSNKIFSKTNNFINSPPKITLWKDKSLGLIDPELFSEKAKDWAFFICKDGQKLQGNRIIQEKNKQSQLRRFYDEVVRLNDMSKRKIEQKHVDISLILPALHMLIAKASYAEGRRLVTKSFVSLLSDGIRNVNTKEDLQIFTNFFEAFIAFYKLNDPKN